MLEINMISIDVEIFSKKRTFAIKLRDFSLFGKSGRLKKFFFLW